MAVLHIGKEEQMKPTRKCCGMRRWILLFLLATIVLSLITALLFLAYGGFHGVASTASSVFWSIFIAFISIGLLSVVLTSAALILNSAPVALSVFAVAVIHILLAIPLIVFAVITPELWNAVQSVPLFVIFILDLLFSAVLAITALLTFIEMRRSRSITVVHSSQPPLSFMASVNKSPTNH
ncbi:hypothetical protein PENTCL1PPCAC_29793 [Pristionchus entomophagus]|uniref:MARVEL domain-containing protein n=1 Tax=Pristionchus entomophagus TaxID=358040 RepID=A0AAV5UMP7_9BILA|nr:hypothetical protein PENTCL1PPCAC_29793 [Pristionchus entomophagus]